MCRPISGAGQTASCSGACYAHIHTLYCDNYSKKDPSWENLILRTGEPVCTCHEVLRMQGIVQHQHFEREADVDIPAETIDGPACGFERTLRRIPTGTPRQRADVLGVVRVDEWRAAPTRHQPHPASSPASSRARGRNGLSADAFCDSVSTTANRSRSVPAAQRSALRSPRRAFGARPDRRTPPAPTRFARRKAAPALARCRGQCPLALQRGADLLDRQRAQV